MTLRWVVATGNTHKVRELQEILGPLGVTLVTPLELGARVWVEETGTTFTANAVLKAHAWFVATGLPALADDSGLCIDALGGAPGVWSARWADLADERPAEASADAANNARLVRELQARGLASTPAHYACALCLVRPASPARDPLPTLTWDPALHLPAGRWPLRMPGAAHPVEVVLAHGTLEGEVTPMPAGAGGFGYDPHFIMPDGHRLAEWSADRKHAVSHRGVAGRALRALLEATPSSSDLG
jgi:XTP/dITP diphosphohydrolase